MLVTVHALTPLEQRRSTNLGRVACRRRRRADRAQKRASSDSRTRLGPSQGSRGNALPARVLPSGSLGSVSRFGPLWERAGCEVPPGRRRE